MKPSELPIQRARGAIIAALTEHRAVVVEGATGCGKTTQVPQILADSGLVLPGKMIGVTQPRRIAAVSVAWRIAHERGQTVPGEVGYAIRFDDQTTQDTRIRVMTDGILLQEARSDPLLSAYSIIMVDEAHERTLNIDFTLGLLRELLDRRDDLRVVISSATINARAFTRFFNDCPRIEVEGMNYPVEIRYRPLRRDGDDARSEALADAVQEIHEGGAPGDILAFFSGENEIKGAMAVLENRGLRRLEVLPIYGRLTREDQERVFDDFPGQRKVILATNIAETSITIDGVCFVIDLGLHKVPSYDARTGVSSLREELISQASARQRLGRAGRTQPGVCIRLYDERSFKTRPLFPTEEVLRMDLIEVVLRLCDLGIRDIERFPLVTAPPRHLLIGAVRELEALNAIDRDRHLTSIGRRMALFPLSPRVARMVVECADRSPQAIDDVLLVSALMSAKWPQMFPPGEEMAAREAHRQFADPLGDVIAGLKMLRAYERARNGDAFAERCFLDPSILREIMQVRDQLVDIAQNAGVYPRDARTITRSSEPDRYLEVLRCVATAFPRQLCRKEHALYETATGVTVGMHPGSCLHGRRPMFVVATEVIITGRPWMRSVSVVDPAWIAEIDPGLAEAWGLKRVAKRAEAAKAVVEPRYAELGDRRVALEYRRGKWTLNLPWADVVALSVQDIGPETLGLELVSTRQDHRFLAGLTLGQALELAPLLDLVPVNIRGLPEGELLEPERDLAILARGATLTGRLVIDKRESFLALFANGVGGYWFDRTRDLRTCLEQSVVALAALVDSTADEDARATFTAAHLRLDAMADLLGT